MRGRPKGPRGAWIKPFLKFLSDVPNVAVACRRAKVTDATVYALKNKSKEFAEQWETAIRLAIGKLEEATFKTASEGDEDWGWYKNKAGALVKRPLPKKKCPALAVFMLKAHAPEKYKDIIRQEITGAEGGKIEMAIGLLKDELPVSKLLANGQQLKAEIVDADIIEPNQAAEEI